MGMDGEKYLQNMRYRMDSATGYRLQVIHFADAFIQSEYTSAQVVHTIET